MKSLSLALCLIASAGQAVALSCIRPDPIQTFNRVAAAPESYFVLYGQLTFDQAALPPGMSDGPDAAPVLIEGFFRGKGLTQQGFSADYVSPALLEVVCFGPWCGSARSGVDALYFVRADNTPVMMEAGPCGGMIFEDPDQVVLERIVTCMQGGPCSAQPLQ